MRTTIAATVATVARIEHFALLPRAMCHLLLGDVGRTFALIDWVDTYPNLFGKLREIRALAHLALGEVDIATRHIRDHCLEAITGRVPASCNDSVLLLAALAHAEGDKQRANELLIRMGLGQSPATTAYARNLAYRLVRSYLLVGGEMVG